MTLQYIFTLVFDVYPVSLLLRLCLSSQIYGVFINKHLSCSDMLTTPTSTDNNEESRERQKEGSCKLL